MYFFPLGVQNFESAVVFLPPSASERGTNQSFIDIDPLVPFPSPPSCGAVKFQAIGEQQNTLPGSDIGAYIGKGRNHEPSQLMLPGIHIISTNGVLNQIL